MNPQITTLPPPANPMAVKTILSKDGFTCLLITLAPGEETPRDGAEQVGEHLLFVTDGQVTVRFDEMNTILDKDDVLLIPRGTQHVIAAGADAGAKLLRVDIPPRQLVVPQIISFER